MSPWPIQILVVEDEPAHAEAVRRSLQTAEAPMDVRVAGSLGEFREAVEARTPDLVLLDLQLPDGRAESALVSPPEAAPFPMVVMTSHGDEQVAVAAIRQGSLDYIVKSPEAFANMPRTVERTLQAWRSLRERREAQAALVASEAALQEGLLFRREAERIARIGAWKVSPQTDFLYWTEGVYEIVEAPPDYRPGLDEGLRLYDAEDVPKLSAALQEALSNGTPFVIEAGLTTWTGRHLWTEVRGLGRVEQNGQAFVMGTFQDITERREAERRATREGLRTDFLLALHQCAPQLTDRELFDYVLERAVRLTASAIGFFHRVSEDQRMILLTTWNAEAQKVCEASGETHYPVDKAGVWATCIREQRPIVINDYPHTAGRSGLPEGHVPVYRFMSIPVLQDGLVRIVFGVGNKASAYDDGDVEQLQVVANELHKIMAQRAAQERLRRSEERFRQLVETTSDVIWEVDASGRYTDVSPKVTDLLGYAPEELLGRSPFEFMPAEEAVRAEASVRSFMNRQVPFANLESVVLHKDGRLFRLETSGAPMFGASGALRGYRGMDRDITERKSLEEQLRQAQKLEAVGQLAGGVAHDFNNILSSIMMQLGFLEMEADLSAEAGEVVADLHRETERAASLTRQLLLFSRRSVVEAVPLDLNELVRNLLKMLGRLIGETIRLVFDVQPGELPTVSADIGLLEQVVTNLVVNARDAMPGGGRVTLATSVVAFGASALVRHAGRRPGRFVCLTVADTGEGMSEETQRRIFEPFFTTKGPGKGTGLGLATVHGIVAQHGGWVEVESAVGRGTTFSVFLPALADKRQAEASPPPRTPLPRGSETILLVEDEASVRQIVAQTLTSLGYRVYEAENGRQALSQWAARGQQIDLLLTDMVMPEGLTGLELAERLRVQRPTLKVVLSSGYSTEIVQTGGVSRADVVYMAKPYLRRVLAETVRACLDAPHL